MFPRLQLGIDVFEFDPSCRQQHQQVVQHVSTFRRQMFLVAGDRGKHRLNRFLAEFLGAFLHALRDQLGGIGRGCVTRGLARGDGGEKAVQGVCFSHGRRLAQTNS